MLVRTTEARKDSPAFAIRPSAYGYMRIPHDANDRAVLTTEGRLHTFAAVHGFQLERIFYEDVCGSHEAFDRLTEELTRSGAHYVLIPSLQHLAKNRFLQNSMLCRLEMEASATVLEMMA